MATKYLLGADWSNPANWALVAAVPVSNDSIFIPEFLDVDVTSGMDQGTVDADIVRIHEDFARNIGASGSPLLMSADIFEHFGCGALYFSCDANGAGLKTDYIRIQTGMSSRPGRNGVKATVVLDSNAADAGEFTAMDFRRGNVTIAGNLLWDANGVVNIGYVSDPVNDVSLNIVAGADTLPTLRQGAGRVVSERAITTAYVSNSALTQGGTAAITTLYVFHGGMVTYNSDQTITTCVVFPGGHLNLLGNTVLKTITTLTALPGSIVDYDSNLHTLSTFNDYRRPRL